MAVAKTETGEPSKEPARAQLLFAQVLFYIVPSPGLGDQIVDSLAKLLLENGAVQYSRLPTDDKLPMDKITHLISSTSDFPDYEAAMSALKAVVKPEWVEASLARGRLQNPRSYSPDPRLFFSGLVVCCADLPTGDKDAIIGGVCAMGGLHTSSVSKVVTHIVALTMDPEKCQTVLTRNLKCKIVLPHWFDDCIKLGKRIDEGPYCLPNPEILRKKPEDRIPDAARPDLKGALSPKAGRLSTPLSQNGHRRQLTVFKNKRVMLSSDLEISSHLRGAIEELIIDGGGIITGSVHKANMFICQYRESLEYRIASRAGSDVGNLPWLYHLITHNTWTSPLRRLLHYPVARQGLPGFKNFRICLSNYNGEARVYLENLAKAAGGEFTKAMREDNTHLITAHTVSEKCEAAKEWNINMVNHLWLEESYAKWEIQTISNTRYTHFPSRTNLGEIVGQTPIDKKAIEQVFFPPGSDVDPAAEGATRTKPVAVAQQPTSKLPTRNAADLSSSAKREGAVLTPKSSKVSGRSSNGADLKTPVSSRFHKEDKEHETPPTTGSRSAKDRAVAKLHDMAPDIALFQKESKRVGGVIFGGRRPSEDERSNANGKRSMSKDEETATDADEELRGVKKAKKSKAPPSMRLLLSGYKRWVGFPKKEGEERTRLRELGILLTQEPGSCSYLAAPSIVRTQKFICALAYGPIVLSTDFVDQCLAENKRLQPEEFELKDTEGEERLGFKLTEVTARAKENKGHLLQGYAVYCTEAVHGGFDTYKAIAEANGGKCLLYRARAGSHAVARVTALERGQDPMEQDSPHYLYLLSGNTPEEVKLWPKFRQMAQGNDMVPRIVKSDWMIDVAMSQRIHWQEFYEWKDDAALDNK